MNTNTEHLLSQILAELRAINAKLPGSSVSTFQHCATCNRIISGRCGRVDCTQSPSYVPPVTMAGDRVG